MKKVNSFTRSFFVITLLVLTVVFAMGAVSQNSYAKKSDKAKGPKCKYQELDGTKIIAYNCDRFQSKGDIDSITPQLKIISPDGEDPIDYNSLPILNIDTDGDGELEPYRALPIRVIISPDDQYTVDFEAASNAGTQYAFLPQIDGLGHVHAYVGPEIQVANEGDTDGDDIDEYSVTFVGQMNRSDRVGGFCVFREPEDQENGYQLLEALCPLWQFAEDIELGQPYRVIVDTTENSHGPRIKHHPRDMPPGDQVIVTFVDGDEEE